MSDEARLWTELGRLGEDPLPGERSDADIVAAAMAGMTEAEPSSPAPVAAEPARARTASRATLVGLLVVAAAAVLLGWWLVPMTGLVGEPASEPRSMAPAVVVDDPAGGRAVERHGRDRRDTSGRAPAVEPPSELDARAPTTSVSSDASEPSEAGAGAAPGASEPTPGGRGPLARPSRLAAPELLEQAQRLVSDGERAAAIATYERLLERFPESREAQAALVSLGRLELERGRATQALARFDAYLAESAGALAEEARYGRIRALRMLGRVEQELRSIEAFLADHPDGLYAARLRRRVEELGSP